jgi:hypothetical protein
MRNAYKIEGRKTEEEKFEKKLQWVWKNKIRLKIILRSMQGCRLNSSDSD